MRLNFFFRATKNERDGKMWKETSDVVVVPAIFCVCIFDLHASALVQSLFTFFCLLLLLLICFS